ncbi:dihydrofolate reductase, partial [Fistulina hepatica ATCC 64428]
PQFLTSVLNRFADSNLAPPLVLRPRVTVTFAQSLDAKIAGQNGKQITLSSDESMFMTHWMRAMHDAILVGVGTALNDDPPTRLRLEDQRHPRPVILDSNLRLRTDCRLLHNKRAGIGRTPWIFCTDANWVDGKLNRRWALEQAGARIVPVAPDADGHPSMDTMLSTLHTEGIHSLMVEGGAAIIRSFSRATVIDTVVITVAPTIVGEGAVGYDVD